MARSGSQVHDSVDPALWGHPRNIFSRLPAERPAPARRADSRRCARLDGWNCLGRNPNGELCMSPLPQGVLRELVLFQATQAQLRPLQPAETRQGLAARNGELALQDRKTAFRSFAGIASRTHW